MDTFLAWFLIQSHDFFIYWSKSNIKKKPELCFKNLWIFKSLWSQSQFFLIYGEIYFCNQSQSCAVAGSAHWIYQLLYH